MSDTAALDQASLTVLRSNEFIDDALCFICEARHFNDISIRVATDKCLGNLALEFCCLHLDRVFPNIHATGVPDKRLAYKEVFNIYQNLKLEFQKDSRTSLPSPPTSSSSVELTMSSNGDASISMTPGPVITRTSPPLPTSSNQRNRRHKRSKYKQKRDLTHCGSAWPQIIEESRPVGQGSPCHSQQLERLTRQMIKSGTAARSDSQATEQVDHPSSERKQTGVRFVATEEEHDQPMQIDHRRLEKDNQVLTAYREFVNHTLRLCQDQYLEEAQAANRAGIFQKASQCQMVVEVVRDLLSDVDFKYFHDHYLLRKSAPPARYWIDSVNLRR